MLNFTKWLENSEIVKPFETSTVPYIVYHGTNKDPFQKFQYQKSSRFVLFSQFDVQTKGFFFSESPHDALDFGKNVLACYINLKKPLLDPRRDKYLGVDRLPYEKEIDLMKILSPMIQKGEKGHYIDYMIKRSNIQNREHPRQWIYDAISDGGIVWDALDNIGVVDKMQKLGYDGTFVSEPDTKLGRSIFIPNPDQVRMIQWYKEPQSKWKSSDDYGINRKSGIETLYFNDENQ
jgi:hypothetical protein